MIAKPEPQSDGPNDSSQPCAEPDVLAAMAGDRQAMARIWQEHRRWIAAVLLTYKPIEVDLEDLLQDVAMKLLDKIDTLREASNLRAWLRAIAVNAARSSGRAASTVRSHKESHAVDQETLVAPSGVGPGHAPASDESQRLVEMVGQLPELYREPLMLRAIKDMKTKQIAEILDVSPATVDTRIARARRMLRDSLSSGTQTSSVPVSETMG